MANVNGSDKRAKGCTLGFSAEEWRLIKKLKVDVTSEAEAGELRNDAEKTGHGNDVLRFLKTLEAISNDLCMYGQIRQQTIDGNVQ